MKSVLTAAIQDVTSNPDVSLEDLAFEESMIQDEIQLALESYMEHEAELDVTARTLESVSQMIRQYQSTGSLSTESFDVLKSSMEDYDYGFSMESYDELSLEKLTGFWNRIKQVYVNQWHTMIDSFSALFKGWNKRMAAHRKINRELISEWNNKKRDLLGNEHKSSMAGQNIWAAFVVDNNLTRKPLETMSKDIEYAEYMLETYPKDISSYLMDLKNVVERGDYSDDRSFERTVLKKVVAMGHPRDVFKLDIVGYEGHPLMSNRGLEEVKGKDIPAAGSGKDYDQLAQMANGTHVKEYVFTWDILAQNHVFHDIYFKTSDVDDMLKLRERYIDLVSNLTGNRFFPVDKMAKEIIKLSPKISPNAASDLSTENLEAIEQINILIKNFKNYLMRPMRMEVARVIGIVTASRTLISRTIATAETK